MRLATILISLSLGGLGCSSRHTSVNPDNDVQRLFVDSRMRGATEDIGQVYEDFQKLRRLAAVYRHSELKGARALYSIPADERAFVMRALDHQAGFRFSHDFTWLAANAAGNLRAREAVPTLIKLLSSRRKHYDMVSAEAVTSNRINEKLRDELLNGEIFDTLYEARVLIERWRR